ncbi:50S ribosome-binding GTPase [Telmatocola sphagniphila]|uniref:50S ribosome-binding GTPase n=1 Tax=Telmatocola sphagniphila TaxID=1123043 RepID=A0A8E6B9R6_9BACT|nr:GTPase [Telmatocola sphagniphila]QVL33168.1 50S ribosome-binding GTPase [Telmatocola sphagniphila]
MAVNLPPHYHTAEDEYKKAKTPEDKLIALKKMWVILPKHKASEKVQMQLKSKMAELNDDIERKSSTVKKSPNSYKIPRQGAGQYVFLGPPNSGKSRLLTRLTKATPEVAPYPFTTREPIPGMMDFENIRLQLIDLPPITGDVYENYLTDFIRNTDAALLIVDLGDDDGPFAVEAVLEKLQAVKCILTGTPPEGVEDPSLFHVKTLLVANKSDAEGAQDRLDIFKEMFGARFPIHVMSAENSEGIDELKKKMYETLGILRVYSKTQGKPADMKAPYTIPIGGDVVDFAGCIHSDLAATVKAAKVWGTGVYDGQTVKKDHVLHEGDIVELLT